MSLNVDEFIRRLRLHILPPRFVKIRHYGWLANRNREQKSQRARELLGVRKPEATPVESEPQATADPIVTCPFCGRKTLRLIERLGPVRTKQVGGFDSS